jgi:hypothetical protein
MELLDLTVMKCESIYARALSDMESSFDAINLAVLNGSLTIDDPVNAGTTIGIAASESINQNADINATGDIEVEAQNGSITMVGCHVSN